jgi:peptide/nickel transport system substrate-binding protein
MRGKEGRGGRGGSKGIGGSERPPKLNRVWADFSFISFASSTTFTSLLLSTLLLLSACSHSVPTQPGVVNFVIETMPTNLDPRIGIDASSERIDGLIFNSLVDLDAQRNPRGELAEKWETPNPLTYVFHLRPGVKFHDGRALTSVDVKYTFDSIIDRTVTSPKRGSLSLIKYIETPDTDTIIFHLSEPYAGFLWNITRPAIGIVPAGSVSDVASHPVGTGPFRFVSAQQDDNVVLERNPSYFGTPATISTIRFRIVPEAIVRALELRKGTADLEMTSLTPDMIPVLKSLAGIEVTEDPGTNYDYIVFNFSEDALAKREVRQALALATDREAIIRYLLRDEARLADGPLPPNNWAYEPDIKRFAFDPQQAEQLLDKAGFLRRPDMGGMRLQLTMKTSTQESTRLLGTAIQEQWRKVGVDLQLKPVEDATLFSDLAQGNFQLSTLRWLGGNNDPDLFFAYVFSSKMMPPAGANRGHYHNEKLDALLDQARVEMDMGKRRKLFSEIQKIVAEDVPYVSLWFRDNVSVHRKRISNVQLSPSGDFDFLRNIQAQ